ncbi:CobW family GTP-binding protein [Phaeobacter sp. PT47_59]|uniref:CobW family GTP-binding protein n=1 Tax=Phaeobacter sp. PT47_59 TaxID=3029979 RepID=UPI002380161B|nr:CobW family GTP-binding protein [Phaeobacter sp. PT47_59]MDE4173902.1 CobW family GTP-binding protein [Phaeobacter sp. PT47_59]
MNRLPVTIISGYLGAGKTTLINRALSEDHGLSLAIIVNDFGAVNIDAEQIAKADGDTITLTNGCICCSMGDDLALSLHQIVNRPDRPDHLVIEASGISDPVAIANTVMAQSGLNYAGIITVVDGQHAPAQLDDEELAPQILQQIRAADLVLISKCDEQDTDLIDSLTELGARTPTVLNGAPVSDLLFDVVPLPKGRAVASHPSYATWHHQSKTVLDRRTLGEKLANRPEGLYRMKGYVLTTGGAYRLHIVGRHIEARHCDAEETVLVALGPARRISADQIETWWNG